MKDLPYRAWGVHRPQGGPKQILPRFRLLRVRNPSPPDCPRLVPSPRQGTRGTQESLIAKSASSSDESAPGAKEESLLARLPDGTDESVIGQGGFTPLRFPLANLVMSEYKECRTERWQRLHRQHLWLSRRFR